MDPDAETMGNPDQPDSGQSVTKGNSRRGRGQRLNFADRYRLLELHRANPGWTYAHLAEQAGVSEETARYTCIAAGRSAADLMSAYAAPMLRIWRTAAERAALRGDHRPAKEWLLHAGVLDQLPDAGKGSGPAVVIVNAPLPGMPGGTKVLDAAAVAVLGPGDGEPERD